MTINHTYNDVDVQLGYSLFGNSRKRLILKLLIKCCPAQKYISSTLLTFAKLQIVGKVTRPPLFYDLDIIHHLLCVEFGLKVISFCSNFPRTRNHYESIICMLIKRSKAKQYLQIYQNIKMNRITQSSG